MKKWYAGVLVTSLTLLLVGYNVIRSPIKERYLTSPPNINSTNPLAWINSGAPRAVLNPANASRVIYAGAIVSDLFAQRNLSNEEQNSLHTWNRLKHLITDTQGLSNSVEAIKEGVVAWKNLISLVEEEKRQSNGSIQNRGKEQCPHFLSKMNASKLDDNGFKLRIPCGLTQGSSITFIGIPNGLLGNFRIDLTGEPIPGEPDPPIILHYNVRLNGDKITEDPVIVQNTWTNSHDWDEEERCPSPYVVEDKKVEELDKCNEVVGQESNRTLNSTQHSLGSTRTYMFHDGKPRKYFPFKHNDLFVATLRVGSEGIQMTVDGKHITSFAFRETLEPWVVGQVRISGDLNLISVVASGLPTSDDLDHTIDLEALKAVPLPPKRQLNLFIGVFSTANNFKRRMAVRRSWMQFPAVRTGEVAVRFFVGLHKNQMVNEELWNEAQTYEDIQLMPFVDYYSLITWKTIGICIFGVMFYPLIAHGIISLKSSFPSPLQQTEAVSAKFVMKTDDDAFVRVDEILNSLDRINATRGLLYGLIDTDSQPNRNPNGKWYISPEEWSEEKYPPWAHGPGYVVSSDIAKAISKNHGNGRLKMFKLEDVAMGIWIADMKKEGLEVKYEKDARIIVDGCKDGYVVAHYQGPRELLCLWQKIQEQKHANCCGD